MEHFSLKKEIYLQIFWLLDLGMPDIYIVCLLYNSESPHNQFCLPPHVEQLTSNAETVYRYIFIFLQISFETDAETQRPMVQGVVRQQVNYKNITCNIQIITMSCIFS